MNGIHDMGGMHGFGPVETADSAAFHGEWEKQLFAVDKLLKYDSVYRVDEKRHAIERMAPATYLEASYFERWTAGIETLLLEKGVVSEAELEARLESQTQEADGGDGDTAETDGPTVEQVRATFRRDSSFDADPVEPAFEEGDEVVVRNDHPDGHTRCPRYVRRACGTVDRVCGTYDVPDEVAHGTDAAEPLYSIEFEAAELWNDDTDADSVSVDLWERYLEPAGTETPTSSDSETPQRE
ncbi:nitrile hydratase subunit beta [Natronorubrum sp. FCH18a]|uniref:nitrile hydratase subunit beta n=1 Tax=Natronorubrum sp. FCH18a TaxID=3447018 RepID=UPI003F5166FE